MSVVFHELRGSPPGSPIQDAVDHVAHGKLDLQAGSMAAPPARMARGKGFAGIGHAETPKVPF
jgi:hypothetical protein